jgi:hypothetical protein
MKRNTRNVTLGAMAALLLMCRLASADVFLDWNTIMLNTISGQSPFAQARFAAITHTAMFEAVNAITGEYEPYLGSIAASPGASAEAAAVAAAHTVLKTYFPSSPVDLDGARATSLAAIPDGQAKTDGIAAGEAAAAAMIAARANDGSTPAQFHTPISTNPGEWQTTTPACPPEGGVLLHWRNVTPFAIESSAQFRSAPPPSLCSNKYRKDYNDVKEVGELNSTKRPQDRSDVARFFATAIPVYLWSQTFTQASTAQNKSLSENARAFALLMMAISDAFVSTFETKYHYSFWRPVTAIQAGDTDGNSKTEPDVAWQPLITAPCFPSYPSAHASGSNAGRIIAEKIFGSGNHDITLDHPLVSNVALHYTKFSQITSDIDDARVYGGIHFRFDQEAGARQGRQVGSYIYNNALRSCGDNKNCADQGDQDQLRTVQR